MTFLSKPLWRCAAFAGVLAASATTAFADGEGQKWDGLFLGVHAGANNLNTDFTSTAPAAAATTNVDNSKWSLAAGGHIGIQKRFDDFVVGAEISYTGLSGRGKTTKFFGGQNRDFLIRQDGVAAATIRVGIVMDDFLLYAKGGVIGSKINIDMNRSSDGSPQVRSSGWEYGFTLGAGAEYAVSENITVGLEYMFGMLFVDARNNVNTPGIVPINLTGIDVLSHAIMARVSFNLNIF